VGLAVAVAITRFGHGHEPEQAVTFGMLFCDDLAYD
jgi:hypothetical protein